MGQGDKKPKPNNKAAVKQYMNRIAQAESGNRMFDDKGNIIQNPNGSAKGPFQFIDSTWKAMEQKLGRKLKRDSWEDNVLAMEKLTEININKLEKEGIPVTDGNIYMLHFMGDSGGAQFLKKLAKDPNALAQDLVSADAVKSNKNVFINKATGKPRTAAELYNEMSGRLKPKTSGQSQQPRFQAFDQTETNDGIQLYEEAPVQTKESTNVNQGRGMRKDIAVPKMKISKAISSVDNQRQSLGLTEGVEFLDADTKLAFTEEQQAEGENDNTEYAKYGGMQRSKKSNYYNDGGNLTEFNEGGTHEESELGGIPQGQSENGQTNLVEEGETKLKDSNYVLSNSLMVNELDADELNLPKDIIGMTFADASKFLNKIAEENGSDHLIMKDVKANLENLTIANEKARINQEELNINQNSDLPSNKMFLGGSTEGKEGSGLGMHTGINQAMTALDLGQTAFGKSGIDTSGKTDADPGSVKPGMMGLSGAMKGVQAGAMFGPLGAGIGGAVGLTAGLIGGFKAKKDATKAHQNFEIGQSNMKISNFNLGGTLNGDPKKNPKTPPAKKEKIIPTETTNSALIEKLGSEEKKNFSGLKAPIAKIEDNVIGPKGNGKYVYYREKTAPGFDPNVDRDFVLDSNWNTMVGTQEYNQYMINLRNKTAQKANSFADGGNLNPFKEEEHTKGAYGYSGNNFMQDQFLSNLNYAKNNAPSPIDESSYISENELTNNKSGYASDELIPSTDKEFKMKGESPLKYAGLVGAGLNYLEDSKLKAREVNLDKLDGKYQKQYSDEASILNNVRNEMNSQVSSLSELGLSKGQLISNLNAAGLNKAKATSDAMQKAQDINRNEDRIAQEFDNRNDIFNIGQSNQEKELTQREQDAVADRKRMSRDALFLSAGELGKEQTYKNRLYNLTGGYDTQGVFKAADGKQYIQNEQGVLVAIPNQEEKKNGGLLGKYDKYLSNKKAEREMYINILKDN